MGATDALRQRQNRPDARPVKATKYAASDGVTAGFRLNKPLGMTCSGLGARRTVPSQQGQAYLTRS